MTDRSKNIRFLNSGEALGSDARNGVSLHCHTLHSKEILDFVPYYAERIPVVSSIWRRVMARHERLYGQVPDFTKGYWEPPLESSDVFASESASLTRLGLGSMVSITDHDSVAAGVELASTVGSAAAPISMEWTVPFRNAFFHIGVHNLPSGDAVWLANELLDYTNSPDVPDDRWLGSLLAMLNGIDDVLIVFNHPLWDIEMIGQEAHEAALGDFLRTHGRWIHAIEVNGFRSWSENTEAIDLAETLGLPIVSGGDRHCCQPNAMINLSDAASFSEFVDEIRRDKYSRIAVLPEYSAPLPSRQLASMAQILGEYRHFAAGRQQWTDRVFLDTHDGSGLTSLTELWKGRPPRWTNVALSVLKVMGHPAMRPIIGTLVGDTDIGRNQKEATLGLSIRDNLIYPTERLKPKSI